MAKYDDLNTKQIFIIGIGSVVVTVITILAVQYVYYLLVNSHESVLEAESSYRRQNTILAEQFDSVSQYGADPETGNVTIPIQQAMEWVAKESQSGTENHTDHANDKDAT
jgi:hypothetical protein